MTGDIPDDIRDRFLGLPDGFSPRVQSLAQEITAGATTPAVLISGYQENAISAATTAELLPVEFLGKPFEVAELLTALRHALAQR